MVYKESLNQEIPDVYEPEYKAMEIFYQKHRHLKLRWIPTITFTNIHFNFLLIFYLDSKELYE